jgi:hypothetical protein
MHTAQVLPSNNSEQTDNCSQTLQDKFSLNRGRSIGAHFRVGMPIQHFRLVFVNLIVLPLSPHLCTLKLATSKAAVVLVHLRDD